MTRKLLSGGNLKLLSHNLITLPAILFLVLFSYPISSHSHIPISERSQLCLELQGSNAQNLLGKTAVVPNLIFVDAEIELLQCIQNLMDGRYLQNVCWWNSSLEFCCIEKNTFQVITIFYRCCENYFGSVEKLKWLAKLVFTYYMKTNLAFPFSFQNTIKFVLI